MAKRARKGAQSNYQKNSKRKKRMRWTRAKQHKFLNALELVGIDAGPKRILEAMKISGITTANVSSHLQKHKLNVIKKIEEEMKEQKMAAQGASSKSKITMQEAASKIAMQEAASSTSPLYWNHTFGRYENANSPARFAPTTMGNWLPNFSTPYVSVLPCLNQFASEEKNQMMFVRSPCTQSNIVEWPVVNGSSMNNNSNQEAYIEALLKNPVVPLIDLTGDSDCEQQQYSGSNLTPQVMNFNPVANYSWPNEPSGAMYTPTSGDGLWDLTWSSVTANKEKNVQEMAAQKPTNAAVFANPLSVPDTINIGSSEQNIVYADAVEGSNNNTGMPLVGDLLLSEDDLAMIDGILVDELVNEFLNDEPVVIGSAQSALFSTNENGTGEINGGGMKNKHEEGMGSSRNDNVTLDIVLESLLMEHGMLTVSPDEWKYFLDLGMPWYFQEVNNAQTSSAEETEDDVANYFCEY